VGDVQKSDQAMIYTRDGKLLYRKSIGNRVANTTITLSDLPSGMTPGVYMLQLILDDKKYVFSILKY
jgi:hypothetical protein